MNKEKTTEELIQLNNDLRRQLTEENEKFYVDLLVYLRTASLFQKEEDVELRLMEILQDILEAQAAGINARAYFGEEPQIIADQLISSFPKAGFQEKVKIFGIIFGISSLFNVFSQLTSNSNQLNLLPLILNGMLTLISVQGFFWLMHNGIYSKQSKSKWKRNIVTAFLSILLFSLFAGTQFLKPEILSFGVSNLILGGFIFSFPIIFTGFTFFGKKKWRSLLLSILPFVWVISGVYLFQKYNIIDFQSNTTAKYGLVTALLLSTFWSQFSLFIADKNNF